MSFPSNWHLSQARADAVKQILLKYVTQKDRIRSEGRGDTNPVVPNTSPENKAKNRRVEITLFTTGEGPKLGTSVERTVAVQP
jgi:type VI secretion system protein ImpK